MHIQAALWLAREIEDSDAHGGAPYWAEGELGRVEVQRTDENEIRLGLQLRNSDQDDATAYLTLAEASRLAHWLGVVVLANELAAHEAANLAS